MRQSLILLVAALAAATVRGQEAFLPVHDLLYEPAPRDPYLEGIRSEAFFGARRFVGERHLARLYDGNAWAFTDIGGRGHFTPDQLQELLIALGLPTGARLWGRSIVVPEAGAAAARQLLEDLRAALPPRLTIEVLLTQSVDGTERMRLHRTVPVEPGRLCVLSEVNTRSAVVDFEVEIAQAAMIANPIVAEARDGVMVAIRPQLAPSGAWAVLETVARWVDDDPAARIDTGHPGLGPIDRAPMRISETGRVVLVRPGARTVQRWSGEHGRFELTLVTQWQLPQPVRPGGHDLGIFSMRGELDGFRSVAVKRSDGEYVIIGEELEEEYEEPWSDAAELTGGDAEWLDGPDVEEAPDAQHFVAMDSSMQIIAAAVTGWFEAHRGGPDLDVRIFDVAAGTEWPADGTVPEGARELGSTRLSQVDGTWSATAVRSEFSIIRDWDAEVAQSSRIPDPRCERFSSGLVINVRSLGDQVEIEGEISHVVDAGAKELTLSAPVFMPEIRNVYANAQGNVAQAWKNDSPALGLISDTVTIENPVAAIVPLRATLRLDSQRPAVHRTSASALVGPGREVLVVVSRVE